MQNIPPIVTVQLRRSEVFLSWTPVENASGYIVSRDPSDGFRTISTARTDDYYAGTIQKGTRYIYQITPYRGTAPDGRYTTGQQGSVTVFIE